jgi:hypothetical protein
MVRTERKDGRRMPRWGVWRSYWVRIGDAPFLKRRIIVICPWFAVLYTRIHRPDEDRDPHDHSRSFMSVTFGGYSEKVYPDPGDLAQVRYREHRPLSGHILRREQAHQITRVSKRLRTLVIAGPYRGPAAFWTPEGKVSWEDYG